LTLEQIESLAQALAASEADAQQQQLCLQTSITKLKEQLIAIEVDFAASQEEVAGVSRQLLESRSVNDALVAETSRLNEYICNQHAAHAAGGNSMR
jgi:hypothetical protein